MIALIAALTGCDWESTDHSSSWNDAYSWVNFSGRYTGLCAGGLIVCQNAQAARLSAMRRTRPRG